MPWQVCPIHVFLQLNEPAFQCDPQRFISTVPKPSREEKAERTPVGTRGRATTEMMCQADYHCRRLSGISFSVVSNFGFHLSALSP